MPTKKTFLSIGLLLISCALYAQFKVTFVVTQVPAYHNPSDPIYLVGSFNGWNPKDEKLVLTRDNGKSRISIELPAGTIEYKFTKGSWEKVESATNGFPTQNRTLRIESDTTVPVQIQHWADHFPKEPVKSTATKNVHMLDSAFYIPQLDRYRRVRIYLPASYSVSRKKYPVLYLQDGQNVFDNRTAGFGEWGVDEALDTLATGRGELIVVAIDHGGTKRINEYAPYDMEKYGKGEGDAYADFLVKTLRPYINRHYRTKKCGKHNYIAGSSMGGLISFYALLKYPKKFGGAGVFSPAFWINPQLKNIAPEKARKIKGKIYFFAGQLENETMVPDMLQVFEQMHRYSKAKMKTVIRAEAKHNEAAWRAEFPMFYKWLLH